jgi:hypothetical protein
MTSLSLNVKNFATTIALTQRCDSSREQIAKSPRSAWVSRGGGGASGDEGPVREQREGAGGLIVLRSRRLHGRTDGGEGGVRRSVWESDAAARSRPSATVLTPGQSNACQAALPRIPKIEDPA